MNKKKEAKKISLGDLQKKVKEVRHTRCLHHTSCLRHTHALHATHGFGFGNHHNDTPHRSQDKIEKKKKREREQREQSEMYKRRATPSQLSKGGPGASAAPRDRKRDRNDKPHIHLARLLESTVMKVTDYA